MKVSLLIVVSFLKIIPKKVIVSRCSHVEFRGEILPMEKDRMSSVDSVAVSYTHLDVYKRQSLGYEEPDDLRITLATIMMDVINEEEISLEDGIDVYKRQLLHLYKRSCKR